MMVPFTLKEPGLVPHKAQERQNHRHVAEKGCFLLSMSIRQRALLGQE
jgi:hypothetical protein